MHRLFAAAVASLSLAGATGCSSGTRREWPVVSEPPGAVVGRVVVRQDGARTRVDVVNDGGTPLCVESVDWDAPRDGAAFWDVSPFEGEVAPGERRRNLAAWETLAPAGTITVRIRGARPVVIRAGADRD